MTRAGDLFEDNQHLLGTLLVNELVTAAFARPQNQRTPFYAFIDEFQHFVTKDTCEILDGRAQVWLHLTLAHQHLHQLKEKDPEVYYSTLTNPRTKQWTASFSSGKGGQATPDSFPIPIPQPPPKPARLFPPAR